jgi:hypothetical protein
MADWPGNRQENTFFKRPTKTDKFFNPETNPDPDQNRHLSKIPIPKVNPAGL